jgi:acyl-CoA thioester hydrolase
MSTDNPFCILLRVRYSECDQQKVVFNARYAEYVDIAATEYFSTLFGNYQALLDQGIDNQVVRLLINWKSSARFDDVISLTVVTTHIGNTSFSLATEIRDMPTQRLIAQAEASYVAVDAATFKKIPISDHYRQKLNDGAKGVRVNFSGASRDARDV